MRRNNKLQRYYEELENIERQRPNALIPVKEVLIRLEEIKRYIKLEKVIS